jgi:hypothetical protein
VGGAHPSWLGYKDRYLFPPYESNPSFFFIRKFNVMGNMFEESKLVEWIENHHYKDEWDKQCRMELISVRPECLKRYVDQIQYKNTVIVIPINSKFPIENLKCALKRLEIKNVIWWALDLDMYELLLENQEMVINVPGLNPMPDLERRKSKTLIQVLCTN